jgi:hypothetical protein
MRIHIPELNAFNGSYYDSYKAFYSIVSYEVLRLNEKFNSRAINDIVGYQVGILMKVMRSFYSLITVIEDCKDYISAASIIRMIADNIASFHLIYHEKNEDEMLLRHYLFILDGFDKRLKEMENHKLEHNGSINDEDFDALKKQVEEAIVNTKQGIQYCNSAIQNLNIYSQHKEFIDILIEKGNWKYSDLEKPKKQKTWNEMYDFIDERKSTSDTFSFLSNFVHGLSISNLTINGDDDDFEPLIGHGIFLMGKINEIANNDFNVDRDFLTDGFLTSDWGRSYFSYYSKERLQEIIKILNKK